MDIKIEKGVPLPNRRTGEAAAVLEKMVSGDSVVIPRSKEQTFRSAAKHHNITITIRSIDHATARLWVVARAPKA